LTGASRLKALERRAALVKDRLVAPRSAAPVEASGFFDPDWYRATYPDLAQLPDLLLHYLRQGYREGRNPGPLFDGARYLRENPDVEQAGVNPVAHFLRAPASEGRVAWNIVPPAPTGRQNLTLELGPGTTPAGTVAVMVHAFYPDTFDSICRALRSIEFPFSLLVSVPDASGRDAALATIGHHRLPATSDVRICPNRGRNFGPLVSEFAADIARHDFVLHLHTKRSLYTGAEQTAWRDELVQALVGSRAVVSAAMELFASRPDVGLLYPTTTDHLAYWAHHWLGNAGHAAGLFSRLGVDTYPTHGYFPYPVGGMFWARVDAVRPLLEAGLTFDDFPAEAGQNDGTLAHAIERSFVPLAHARGYRYVEFDAATGGFQLDWSTLNLEQYLRFSVDGLHQAIERADLVSFDIFDTVITRLSARPDSVMRSVGTRLLRDFPEATGYFERRKQAELAAREAKDWAGDVSLTEIYRQFALDGGWSSEAVEAARALEIGSELATSLPRTVVAKAVAMAAESGKRVIAMSDTYLEREHIEQLLELAGVGDCFDEIYLSSECGFRKDRGDMWGYLRSRELTPSDRWLHVGDNEHADIQAATDLGIATYHCMNPATLMELRGLSAAVAVDDARWGTDLLLGPTVARIANDPFPENGHFSPVDIPSPAEFGYAVFGPVVLAFLAWLANHAQMESIDHLYFLSREGHLLRSMWERIRASGAPELPPSTYLLTSRRSSMATAQAVRFDVDELLEGSGFEGSVGQLLQSRLGLHLAVGAPYRDRLVRLPEDEVVVRAILEDLRDGITAHGTAERAAVTAYLERSGLTSGVSAGIVDIGYSATIQKHLQTVLGRGLTGFYMGTIAKAAQVEAQGGAAYGSFIENHPAWTTPTPFLLHSLILEAFLTAPHGQTERTEVVDGEVSHSFRPDHRSDDELEILDQLHAGAASYCEDLLEAYGRTILDVPIDADRALDLVIAFATGSIRSQRVASALVVDDDFCGVSRRGAQVTSVAAGD
jgi:FMN phosphatase YigB (HAD superfamily)